MFTWPVKWILKKVLAAVIPALVALGLLQLAGVDVEGFINDLLGELGTEEEPEVGETVESTTAAN